MSKIINLPVHVEDALLLIGVLEHAISEGERNLEDQNAGRATFDMSTNDAKACLMRLRAWVETLRTGHPSPHGFDAVALGIRPVPALSRWTVLYTRIPTNYNPQHQMTIEAESEEAAREVARERLGDRGKQFHTYSIDKVKPYEPVKSRGRVVEGG